MPADPTIIVLSGYPDIFQQFYNSVSQYEPAAKKILVTSGKISRDPGGWRENLKREGWTILTGQEPFIYARNVNQAVKACDGDVLLVNDDVQFLKSGTVGSLRGWTEWRRDYGIVSPQISGIVGNPLQSYETLLTQFTTSQERLCFVCVYIRREVFNTIGYLDESFDGYGRDDDDFCRRAAATGFQLGVVPNLVVLHGFQGQGCSNSFLRQMTPEQWQKSSNEMLKKYQEKWSK